MNIEVQLRNFSNMDKRSLFYWSRKYANSIKSGKEYQELPGVIAINIIDFEFIAADDFHTCFHLWEDNYRDCMLTEDLEIHFIDMVKFRHLSKKDIINNPLHRWLTFFDKNADEKILKEVIKMDATIQKIQDIMHFVQANKEEFRAYEMRELGLMDQRNRIDYAQKEGRKEGLEEGLKKGLEKGIKQGFSQIILNLSAKGMSSKEISDLINMPVKQVNKYMQ